MLHLLGPSQRARNGSALVRISDDLRKCVVFFGVQVAAGGIKYGGTGFLVHTRISNSRSVVPYLVTARHVANRLDVDFVIRANLKAGGAEEIKIETMEWFYPEDPSVDLAIAPYTLSGPQYDHYYFPLDDAPPPMERVICGDPIAIVGLFRLHKGNNRNIAIVHSGHVAALADRSEPIPSKDRGTGAEIKTVAHLVEAQTLDGLSGSPVFVQGFVHFSFLSLPDKTHPVAYGSQKLFGIYQGSWESEPGVILAEDRGFGGEIRVPVGVGLVTPAEELISLISSHKEAHAAKGWTALDAEAAVMDSALDHAGKL
jgi:Trypsin-like peptidase domain